MAMAAEMLLALGKAGEGSMPATASAGDGVRLSPLVAAAPTGGSPSTGSGSSGAGCLLVESEAGSLGGGGEASCDTLLGSGAASATTALCTPSDECSS